MAMAPGELRFFPRLTPHPPPSQRARGARGCCHNYRVHTGLKIQPRTIYSFIVFRSVTLWVRITNVHSN